MLRISSINDSWIGNKSKGIPYKKRWIWLSSSRTILKSPRIKKLMKNLVLTAYCTAWRRRNWLSPRRLKFCLVCSFSTEICILCSPSLRRVLFLLVLWDNWRCLRRRWMFRERSLKESSAFSKITSKFTLRSRIRQ